MSRTPGRSVGLGALGLALVASSLLGCGPDQPPEARLEGAGEALEDARGRLEEARERHVVAQQGLREARKQLRQAERAVLSAEQRLSRRATEVALFRAVQKALLEDPALRQEAISARVDGSRVTLEGEVSEAELQARALEVARGTPGVEQVTDDLEVADEASPSEG